MEEEKLGWVDWFISLFDIRNFPPKKKFRFGINLALGILIALVSKYVLQTEWGETNINWALDYFVKSEALKEAKNSSPENRVAFIDIDFETFRGWGEPLFIPRDKLGNMVKSAAQGGAKVILLDILLEHPDYDPKKDESMRQVLEEIASSSMTTKIVFPVKIGYSGDRKKNLFDDVIDKYPERFFRGIPSLSATQNDRVVRHWRLFGRYKSDKLTKILWGTPFLAAILACGKEKLLDDLEKVLIGRKTGTERGRFSLPLEDDKRILLSVKNTDFFLQRIRFFLIPKGIVDDMKEGNVRPITPNEIETVMGDSSVAKVFFENRIVVIGNSSPDCGDIHPTPLGYMPGMYVMGNSVNTILSGIQPTPSSKWADFAIELCMIVMGAYIFLHLSSMVAQLVAPLVILSVFGSMSYWYFMNHGVFLNFVFSMVGMQLLGFLLDVGDTIHHRCQIENSQDSAQENEEKSIH